MRDLKAMTVSIGRREMYIVYWHTCASEETKQNQEVFCYEK